MPRRKVDTVEVAVRVPRPVLERLAAEAMTRGVSTPNLLIRDILVARDMGQGTPPPAGPAAQAPPPPPPEPEPPEGDAAQALADEWLSD
jgi:hypothetical protein